MPTLSRPWRIRRETVNPSRRRHRAAPLQPRRPSLPARLAILAATALAVGLPLAPAAVAAGSLTLTTPYPAVEVAPGSKVSFDLTVKTPTDQRIDLSVDTPPSGWTATLFGGGFVIDGVQTTANTAAAVRLDVKVPASATAGTTTITVRASGGGASVSLPLSLKVTAQAAGAVTLTTDVPSVKGPSSGSFSFTLTLSNDTAQDLTFGATATGPDGWTVSATLTGQTQAASAVVKSGSTADISVTAKPPSNAAAGTYPVHVIATAGSQQVTADVSVQITGSYTLTFTTPDQRLSTSGSAGSTITQQLVVQNDGTAPLTNVVISATPPTNWTITYSPSATIASVAAGQSATVTANIVPSSDAIAGDYSVPFTATANEASGSEAIRVTIDTSPLWGIVGLGLIVVVLVGLWWVFQRYGRR